jgi:hypothetical protein
MGVSDVDRTVGHLGAGRLASVSAGRVAPSAHARQSWRAQRSCGAGAGIRSSAAAPERERRRPSAASNDAHRHSAVTASAVATAFVAARDIPRGADAAAKARRRQGSRAVAPARPQSAPRRCRGHDLGATHTMMDFHARGAMSCPRTDESRLRHGRRAPND